MLEKLWSVIFNLISYTLVATLFLHYFILFLTFINIAFCLSKFNKVWCHTKLKIESLRRITENQMKPNIHVLMIRKPYHDLITTVSNLKKRCNRLRLTFFSYLVFPFYTGKIIFVFKLNEYTFVNAQFELTEIYWLWFFSF